jgi:hypothetical protein
MRHTTFAPSRRHAFAMAIAPLALLLGGLVPSAAGATAAGATAAPVRDPAVGPNAQQERALGGRAVALTPDTSLPPAAARPQGSTHAKVSASSTAKVASGNGTLTHEVFGYAPYWELGNWSEWQMRLLSTIAYFGVTLDGAGNPVQGGEQGWTGWNSSQLTSLINSAHASGVRVVLTI